MLMRCLADLVLLAHLAFVVFVLIGGLLIACRSWWRWIHLPAAIWGLTVEATGWGCPLTRLENTLRRAAGEAGYDGGFVEHYLIPLLYPDGLTRNLQFIFATVVLVVNVAIYFGVARRRRLKPDSLRR